MRLVWFSFTDTVILPNNVGFPKKKEEKKKARTLPEEEIKGRGDSIIISDMCKLRI